MRERRKGRSLKDYAPLITGQRGKGYGGLAGSRIKRPGRNIVPAVVLVKVGSNKGVAEPLLGYAFPR